MSKKIETLKQRFMHVLIPCCLILSCISNAQEYNVLLNNSSWNYEVVDVIGSLGNFGIMATGNENINGQEYIKFQDDFNDSNYFLREEPDSKRVFKIINGQEVLLFDFGLNVGENVTLGNGEIYNLVNIVPIIVYGGMRNQFELVNISNPLEFNYEIWIEGVGNREHPLLARYELFSDPVFYLNCSYQNGVNIYNRSLFLGQPQVDCSALNTSDFIPMSTQVKIFPIPLKEDFTIESSITIQNGSILIYNLLGQLIEKQHNLNGNKITVSAKSLNKGVYILALFSKNQILLRKSVLVE